MRITIVFIICLFLVSHVATAEETTASQKYEALVAAFEEDGGTRDFAKRFVVFAREHIDEPAAADALLWVVDKVRGRRETAQAIMLLEQHHAEGKKMGPGCKFVSRARSVGAEKLLRVTLEKNKDKHVQAQACFYLAQLLDREASIIEQLRADPDLAPRVLQYYDKEYGDHLASLEPVELARQREKVYERLFKSFADVEIDDEDIGKIAEDALYAIRHLSVGKLAPEIKGIDISGNEFKLSDYRGKVVMLSFWAHW
ncbi:MAG: redoxin domain-containing protein [Pirellulaceae bacterium]|jgi:hypothetical protein|nr:redoxin domain-containing protein [Pirellulaceae bacterium]MDP7303196.1 redoxin domain-containing protein [Pirellulaceae bacterium]HJN10805.1 hypothetical protein [Pirellulaceae bacterium]